ncbi:MAG: hypothetical protein BGN88_08595 [Clostridiales bacterium 43-6]|nr:MAG: hypothetical protein BGN88_08595 [Clostridiales bacterium 43-6]
MILFYIIGGAVLVLILWFIASYNNLIKLRNNTQEAYSTMDVYLKKRYDLIPNIVETVKGYAKHESETLESVIKARNAAMSASTAEDKISADNVLTGTLKSLFALSEAYPDLKANINFLDLQKELKKVEEDIANSRKYYNAVVNIYNIKTEVIPSSIVASICHFERKPMYLIDEGQRENIKISF